MPLWGTEDTAAAKPQIGGRSQNAIKAREIFATAAGWSQVGSGRATTGKQHELLVAMRGLSTVLIGGTGQTAGSSAQVKASITSMNWNITTWDVSNGGTLAAGTSLSISANFNEAVTVASGGSMKLVVTNGNQGSGSGRGPHNLLYVSGTGSNRLTFELAIAAAQNTIKADDVLVIGANAIAHAGGSAIYDTVAGAGTAAVITNSAGIGTAAGSITAVA